MRHSHKSRSTGGSEVHGQYPKFHVLELVEGVDHEAGHLSLEG